METSVLSWNSISIYVINDAHTVKSVEVETSGHAYLVDSFNAYCRSGEDQIYWHETGFTDIFGFETAGLGLLTE